MPLARKERKATDWRARGEYQTLEGALGAAARMSAACGHVVVQVARGARAFMLFASTEPAPEAARVVAFVRANEGARTGSKQPGDSR